MRRNITIAAGICTAVAVACIVGATVTNAGTAKPHARRASIRPNAEFSALPASGVAPLTVKFTDGSTGSPTNWRWDFGDGTTANGQTPVHVYAVAGAFTVKLVVSNAAGTSTLTKSNDITVTAPPRADWKTIIDDQFNTPGLPSHWLPYSGSYAGDPSTCASPSQVTVAGDGYLHLKMEYRTSGVCGRDWYTGGMQLDRAYGGIDQAVTVRWRIVPSADPDIVRSTRIIPMRWVDDPDYAWYQGEADYCEGSSLDGCYIYLHYGPNYQQILHGYSLDLTQWHTFRIEQRDHQVRLYIDNMTTPIWVYKGDATTVPDAFMRTVLQQMCTLTSGCPPASYAGDVEDIQIDWITIQNAVSPGATSAATPNGASAPLATAVRADVRYPTSQRPINFLRTAIAALNPFSAPSAESRRKLLAKAI